MDLGEGVGGGRGCSYVFLPFLSFCLFAFCRAVLAIAAFPFIFIFVFTFMVIFCFWVTDEVSFISSYLMLFFFLFFFFFFLYSFALHCI